MRPNFPLSELVWVLCEAPSKETVDDFNTTITILGKIQLCRQTKTLPSPSMTSNAVFIITKLFAQLETHPIELLNGHSLNRRNKTTPDNDSC